MAKQKFEASQLRSPMLALLEELDQALNQNGLDDHSVHQVRVGIKRLRAWWRLMRPLLSNTTDFKRADTQLRALAHSLATRRDETILSEILPAASPEYAGRPPTAVAATETQAVLAAIGAASQYIRGAHLPAVPAKRLLKIDAKRERRLRKRGLHARKHPKNIERAHAWRRQVKYLQYQREYLQRLELPVDAEQLRLLKQLGEALGDYHDRMIARRHAPKPGALKRQAEQYFQQARKVQRQLFP